MREETERVFLEQIRLTGDGKKTQMREALDQAVVEQYAEAMERGEYLPVVELVPAGDGTYYVADGWHRIVAHASLRRGLVEAAVHPVPDGETALDVALRAALRANRNHGLHLTRGDQKKKARTALLMPVFQDWPLRALEAEIGVSKSTVGRVRADLVREGLLPHPYTGEPMPDWMPDNHASLHKLSDPFEGDHDLREQVYRYVSKLTAAHDPKDWEWADGKVFHSGLIDGQEVAFAIEDNLIVDGLPTRYQPVEPRAASARKYTPEELDRFAALRARREFAGAAKRLMARSDKELSRAVDTLAKRRDQPGLFEDLRTLLLFGGPDDEHIDEDF